MKLNMMLNKRYARSIRKNLIFYIAASLLTMLCVMAFAILFTCGLGIQNYVTDIFQECVVEDANVQTLFDIDSDDIANYEENYHILMEKQEYLNIYEVKTLNDKGQDVTAKDIGVRIFKENTKINKYKITHLNDGLSYTSVNDLKDDEILINEKYANKHNISLNNDQSRIILSGKEYKVVGFFVRPDYLYGLVEITDSYPNYDAFMIGYVNNNQYNSLLSGGKGKTSATKIYSMKYNIGGETDVDALRATLFGENITAQYNAAQTSGRIKVFYNRPRMFISFAFLFLAIAPFLIVTLISIILNIKVKNDQKIIGTLSALGYRDSEICFHYSIMAMIPGIIGGILMTIIVYIGAHSFGEVSTGDFEVMHISFIYPWYTALAGIIIPTLIYGVSAIFTIKRLINKPITSLLQYSTPPLGIGSHFLKLQI